jgi:peptide deformylase
VSDEVEQDAVETVEVEGEADASVELDPEVLERRRAALAEVRKFGDPVLNTRAASVRSFDGVLAREIEQMIGIMRDGYGVGLAATQLGILHRVLVFQAGLDSEPTAVVNPELEWTSEQIETAQEGCLSLPGVIVDVGRPLHARVTGLDPGGEQLMLEASGLEARVLQHEIDHLDGVLILDRTDREQRREALRTLREGAEPAPAET